MHKNVIYLPDADRHFILACKHHYGPTIDALIRIYQTHYNTGNRDPYRAVFQILVDLILKYDVLENETQIRHLLLDLGTGLSETSTPLRHAIWVVSALLADWQVAERTDSIRYELGEPNREWTEHYTATSLTDAVQQMQNDLSITN